MRGIMRKTTIKRKSGTRQGHLITNGVVLEKHEMTTINFLLLCLGADIELMVPSSRTGSRTPDFRMLGVFWEMKSPCGRGKYLMRDTVARALEQSGNIVIDLRRAKLYMVKCLNDLEGFFAKDKRIKRMMVIINNSELVDLKRC